MASFERMAWYPISQKEMHELLSFLRTREWSCVSFSSRLLNREGGSNRVFINRSPQQGKRIIESLLLTSHGLVLPAIDPSLHGADDYRHELLPLIRAFVRDIHSIMGLDEQVRTLESLLNAHVYERVDYYLMTREYFNIERPPSEVGTLKIRKATPFDVRSLFPLQREYEKEEVLLDPGKFNSTASFLTLQKNLRKEIIYLAEVDGVPVAKAGTNARGLNYYQIGGVYTLPSLRSQGIARAIMQVLMWDIAQRKKHLSLFVKRNNPAAIKLYSNLGFSLRDKYAISYYRT